MAAHEFDGRRRRPRVQFAETDQEYYHPGRAQLSWNNAPQLPSRRRRRRSSDDHHVTELEPDRVVLSSPTLDLLEGRAPVIHEEPAVMPPPPLPPQSSRRPRSRIPFEPMLSARTLKTGAFTSKESAQPVASHYAQSPGLEANDDGVYLSYQRRGRENTDREFDRARSASSFDFSEPYGAERLARGDVGDDTFLRPPSLIGADLDAHDEFDFLFQQSDPKDEDLSELDSLAVDTDSAQREDHETPELSTAKRIYVSQYCGNAEPGGNHIVELTELLEPKGRKHPLFRWLHIQQKVMRLNEFWVEISRQLQFSDSERTAITKLRADIQKHCIKTRQNPQGAKVGYMEPRCFEVPFKTLSKKMSGQEEQTGSARWICLPYFSLQKYSGFLSGSTVNDFPAQTLLQAQYSRTTEQRDMQQAVCQVNTTEKSRCFHIAQLWCLILDNSLVITCGAMSEADLCRDSVNLKSQPAPDATTTGTSGRIIVKYGNAVTWNFPAVACPTWFKFLANFHVFWPRNVEFRYNSQLLTAKIWPKILQLASRPQGSVTLTLQIVPRTPLPRAVLDATAPDAVDRRGPKGCQIYQEYLHVLTLQPVGTRSKAWDGGKTCPEKVKAQLALADKYLSDQASYATQRAYKNCKEVSRDDIHRYLAKQDSVVQEKASDGFRVMHQDRLEIYQAATNAFCLFFPSDFDGPTTRKFWGSIQSLVQIPQLGERPLVSKNSVTQYVTTEVKTTMKDMCRYIQLFQNTMSHTSIQDRANIDPPREFVTAWLYMVSGLINTCEQGNAWLAHMLKAQTLILDGMSRILQGISSQNLLEVSVVLPLEIVSLFSLNLLRDQVGKTDDVMETYAQYLALLDAEITSQPSDRTYQHCLDLVQQEMTVIKRTLAKQRAILASVRANISITEAAAFFTGATDDGPWRRRRPKEGALGPDEPANLESRPRPYYGRFQDAAPKRHDSEYMGVDDQEPADLGAASKLSPIDELGFRGLFLTDCIQLVEQREFELRRHTDFADDLERAVEYSIDWTRDRQENAVYAFTIVTVVFLPLSAISSIFGMNSSDVRDMNYGQWLYWAIALPVTGLIIFLGLWWMGELRSVTQWVSGKRTNRIANAGYVPGVAPKVPDGPTYVMKAEADADYPVMRTVEGAPSRTMAYIPEQSIVRRSRRRPRSAIQ